LPVVGVCDHVAAAAIHGKRGEPVWQGTESDHHGNAAGPRQHGDVARRAAARQRDGAAVAPVGFEEACWGDVIAHQDDAGRGASFAATGEMAQHPVTDVAQVGGAGAEIIVVGGFVAGDLAIERGGPGRICGGACVNRRERRRGERIVLQHRDLEAEHVLRLAVDAFDQPSKIGDGMCNGLPQGRVFDLRAARSPSRENHVHEVAHRADEQPVGSAGALVSSAHRPLRRSRGGRG